MPWAGIVAVVPNAPTGGRLWGAWSAERLAARHVPFLSNPRPIAVAAQDPCWARRTCALLEPSSCTEASHDQHLRVRDDPGTCGECRSLPGMRYGVLPELRAGNRDPDLLPLVRHVAGRGGLTRSASHGEHGEEGPASAEG